MDVSLKKWFIDLESFQAWFRICWMSCSLAVSQSHSFIVTKNTQARSEGEASGLQKSWFS